MSQRSDFIVDRLLGGIVGEAVEIGCGQSVALGTEDIRLEIVANHQGAVTTCARLSHGIVEEGWRRFVGSCILAEDDGIEIVGQSTGPQLLVLHLVETVGAHVHAIALLAQVVHQCLGTVHQSRLVGAEVQEQVAGLQTQLFGRFQALAKTQRTAETLDNQVVARNFSLGIACPQVDICLPILVLEQLWVWKPLVKMQCVEKLTQGNHGIAVGVVKGVVEVDE